MNFDSDNFLQRMYEHRVSSVAMARHLAGNDNHQQEVGEYLTHADIFYVNRVLDEAREIARYDDQSKARLKAGVLGKFLGFVQ